MRIYIYKYIYRVPERPKNLTCNEREALRISARYVLGLSASVRGFAAEMTFAGRCGGANAGAIATGFNFCDLFLLRLL